MSANTQQTNASDTPIPEFPKQSWPELVGLPADEAVKKIKEEMNDAYTPVVPVGSFMTMDWRLDRVRVFVDAAGKVVGTPKVG